MRECWMCEHFGDAGSGRGICYEATDYVTENAGFAVSEVWVGESTDADKCRFFERDGDKGLGQTPEMNGVVPGVDFPATLGGRDV